MAGSENNYWTQHDLNRYADAALSSDGHVIIVIIVVWQYFNFNYNVKQISRVYFRHYSY